MRTRENVLSTLASTTTVNQLPAQPPDQAITEFLAHVSMNYIASMRSATPGNALFGGDIELIEIADILNVCIILHRHEGYTINNGAVFSDCPAIGQADTPTIHLALLEDPVKHYQIYVPGVDGTRPRFIDVPGDGNCLFHACIRAKKLLDLNATEETVSSTVEETRVLRGQVCDRLQSLVESIARGDEVLHPGAANRVRLNNENDPIWSRFNAIFKAKTLTQLNVAINDLAAGDLVNEAKAIKQVLSPELMADRGNGKNKKLAISPVVAQPTEMVKTTPRACLLNKESKVSVVLPANKDEDAEPLVQPIQATAKAIIKPLVLDPTPLKMKRNTTPVSPVPPIHPVSVVVPKISYQLETAIDGNEAQSIAVKVFVDAILQDTLLFPCNNFNLAELPKIAASCITNFKRAKDCFTWESKGVLFSLDFANNLTLTTISKENTADLQIFTSGNVLLSGCGVSRLQIESNQLCFTQDFATEQLTVKTNILTIDRGVLVNACKVQVKAESMINKGEIQVTEEVNLHTHTFDNTDGKVHVAKSVLVTAAILQNNAGSISGMQATKIIIQETLANKTGELGAKGKTVVRFTNKTAVEEIRDY